MFVSERCYIFSSGSSIWVQLLVCRTLLLFFFSFSSISVYVACELSTYLCSSLYRKPYHLWICSVTVYRTLELERSEFLSFKIPHLNDWFSRKIRLVPMERDRLLSVVGNIFDLLSWDWLTIWSEILEQDLLQNVSAKFVSLCLHRIIPFLFLSVFIFLFLFCSIPDVILSRFVLDVQFNGVLYRNSSSSFLLQPMSLECLSISNFPSWKRYWQRRCNSTL